MRASFTWSKSGTDLLSWIIVSKPVFFYQLIVRRRHGVGLSPDPFEIGPLVPYAKTAQPVPNRLFQMQTGPVQFWSGAILNVACFP